MKKLNITKEQFNRSSYFRNKYGKLEYVSESGKLFKTNKGKVLMFKESIKDIAPGIQDWGTTVYIEELGAELDWKEVFGFVKADCRLYPLLEEDIGVKPYKEPSDRQIRNWIKTKPENFIDYLKEFGYYDYANGTDRDDLEYESTKKFGKKFNESWNKDDYDDQPRKFRPKFDIGEKVSLTKDFYKEFHHYYNDMPEKFTKGAYYLDDIPEDGWIIEDVKTEDGIEGATGLHRPYYQYYITNLDMDSGYEDDSINGIWVYPGWIKSAEGSVKESTKKFGKKFNESADQTLEDIIDNIVTLSILSRDAESAEEMFQDLKQELSNMGLLSGQIHEDFDDFHDIAIDFAENHNFNKQFVEQAAVTLKSQIEQELSRSEFGESTRRARRSARRFNESIDSDDEDIRNDIAEELNSMADTLNELKELAIERLEDRKLASELGKLEEHVSGVYFGI